VAEKVSDYPKEDFLDRIVVKDRHKIHIIPVDQVRYIESMDDYVMIYTREGRYMKQKTMKYLEGALNPKILFAFIAHTLLKWKKSTKFSNTKKNHTLLSCTTKPN
jgi:hypothetical protein